MRASPSPRSQPDVLDSGADSPQLRVEPQLVSSAPEDPTPRRAQAQRTWQAAQASVDDVVRDRAELERMDRGLLALRKHSVAARNETTQLREQLEQAKKDRYPAAVVWGAGMLAIVGWAAWLLERRQRIALEDAGAMHDAHSSSMIFGRNPGRSSIAEQSPAPSVADDKVEPWIESAEAATPKAAQ
ncbi:MAG TPA: hypothetical protein VHA82_16600 [Ramlibacter sp.]|uniref:hypothetical protein n=1 Tax=Ramlibacter sp. TaxID=1917967 RepID=UPI002C86BF42|nr:hypothetical protein [Ramlibacter sp.]HVZ45433.1 hypothetical protein [Ramlibacter sp.]